MAGVPLIFGVLILLIILYAPEFRNRTTVFSAVSNWLFSHLVDLNAAVFCVPVVVVSYLIINFFNPSLAQPVAIGVFFMLRPILALHLRNRTQKAFERAVLPILKEKPLPVLEPHSVIEIVDRDLPSKPGNMLPPLIFGFLFLAVGIFLFISSGNGVAVVFVLFGCVGILGFWQNRPAPILKSLRLDEQQLELTDTTGKRTVFSIRDLQYIHLIDAVNLASPGRTFLTIKAKPSFFSSRMYSNVSYEQFKQSLEHCSFLKGNERVWAQSSMQTLFTPCKSGQAA
jgi:hypothetical protein